jgi:hypothetical protein
LCLLFRTGICAATASSIREKTNQETSVATSLHHLRLALRLIYPDIDWSWLLTITKRIAATAPRKARKHGSMTSERLYLLGIELMDRAVADARRQCKISKVTAMVYRDGLLIALLALFIPRRRTVTAMRVGKQLVRAGELWALDIPPEDTKNGQALDFPISADMSRRIDTYLQEFRIRLPGAVSHNGLWVSNKRRPMSDSAIYDAVHRRTKKSLWVWREPALVPSRRGMLLVNTGSGQCERSQRPHGARVLR